MIRGGAGPSAAVLLLAALLVPLGLEGSAMSQSSRSEPLLWQGAADRTPVRYLALRVERVRKEGGGLFGIGNSPSLAGALPDARVIEGRSLEGETVEARVPAGEIPAGVAAGSRLVLGLVDPGHLICMLPPPDSIPDAALADWARSQRCG